MKNKLKDWLEETWEIKKRITSETINMDFKEYWNYLESLSKTARANIKKNSKKLVNV